MNGGIVVPQFHEAYLTGLTPAIQRVERLGRQAAALRAWLSPLI